MDLNATQVLPSDPNRTVMGAAPTLNATQTIKPVQCPICKTFNPAGMMFCVECGLIFDRALPDDAFGAPVVRLPVLVEESGREHPIRAGENLVGREGDVMLADAKVSRKHARIVSEDGAMTVEDLGSTNGTTLNGEKLEPGDKRPLNPGDKVAFGGVELVLSLPGQAGATEMLSPTKTAMISGPPVAWDEGTSGREGERASGRADEGASGREGERANGRADEGTKGQAGDQPDGESQIPDLESEISDNESAIQGPTSSVQTPESPIQAPQTEPQTEPAAFLLVDGEENPLKAGANTFGRKAENDVQIADPYVSGRHGQIEVEEDGIYLTDLGSTNGTFLNGEKLDPNVRTLVREEDEVKIGALVLQVRSAEPEAGGEA